MNRTFAKQTPGFQRWLREQLFEKKLNSGLGITIMILLGGAVCYLSTIDYRLSIAVPAFFAGIVLVLTCIKYPYFSFYFTIGLSSVLYLIGRLLNLQVKVPYGVLIEVFIYITVIGILVNPNLRAQITRKFWFNPISIAFYFMFAYYLVELFNPEMESVEAYFNYIRKQVCYFFFYYAAFSLLNSKARIIFFSYFLVVIGGLMAAYTCKQQWFGLADFEWVSIMRIPDAYDRLFQGGYLRKFSTMADPATAGILFAAVVIQTMILTLRNFANYTKGEKILLYTGVLLGIMACSFTGTRTATLMLVTGIMFYGVATINERRTLFFLIGALGVVAALMVMPIDNIFVNRMKTAFQGTADASAAIRDINRHAIQPYLFAHPLGGGIFTCGEEGAKYNPGHFLATFQPDGGYMKTLAEQGMVGLAILLIFYMAVMRQGILTFYRAKDPDIQNHSIALLAMMFTLLVGHYSQLSLNQFPLILIFFGTMAVFLRFSEFDYPENAPAPNLQT